MRIGTEQIYTDYITTLEIEKSSLIEDKASYLSSKDYLLNKLEAYKHYIVNFTNIRYEDINTLMNVIPTKAMKYLAEVVGSNHDYIRRDINIIVELNKSLVPIQKRLDQIETEGLKYVQFKKILHKFNVKVSDEIVYKGYVFNLGDGLGHIRIKKVDSMYNKDGSRRTKKRIDWNESNIKRKEIEARGGTPYAVTKREGRQVVADNGGEKWFVYHNQRWDYLWHWYKGHCSVPNTPYYRFRPTIYNNSKRSDNGRLGNVNKLKHLVTSKSPLLANFAENIIEVKNSQGHTDTLWKGHGRL